MAYRSEGKVTSNLHGLGYAPADLFLALHTCTLPCPSPPHQVDLSREAANLERFNTNFRRTRSVSFPEPLYPLVSPDVLVESFEAGRHIRYTAATGTAAKQQQPLSSSNTKAYKHIGCVHKLRSLSSERCSLCCRWPLCVYCCCCRTLHYQHTLPDCLHLLLCSRCLSVCVSVCVSPYVLCCYRSVYITGAQGSDPYRARLAELGSGTMLQVSYRTETTHGLRHMSEIQQCEHFLCPLCWQFIAACTVLTTLTASLLLSQPQSCLMLLPHL